MVKRILSFCFAAIPVIFFSMLLVGCSGNSSTASEKPTATQSAQSRTAVKVGLPRRATKTVATTAADYQDAVQDLYIAYFGRPADPNGLANFEAALLAANAPPDLQDLANAYATNPSVKSLIDSFQTSAESLALYGSGNTTSFVQTVFQNVLGRQPASSGLQFWVSAIESGSLTQSDAALAIMAGGMINTTSQGLLDAQLIDNRVAAATYFTAQLTALGDISVYRGKSAASTARGMLGGVIASTTSANYEASIATTVTGLVASGSLAGIAANGAPIQNATVTLKDSAGNVRTATTGADGSFVFSLVGLNAPLLLSVNAGAANWYSFAGAANATANLNAYTTVLLQAFYQAGGTDVATVFNGTISSATIMPNLDQIALVGAPMLNNLQPYLVNAGVANPTQFNPFTAVFSANSSGFDRVLDRTSVNAGLTGYTVDSGSGGTAGSLSSTVTLNATSATGSSSASISISAMTTNGSSTSSSQVSVPIATSSNAQSDLAAAESGVLALFQSLGQLSSNGSAVTAASIMPLIDPAFLDEGRTQATFAAELAQGISTALSGSTVSIYRINKFTDGTTKYLDATLEIQSANGQLSFVDDNDNVNVGMVFKQAPGGSWVFYGQQTVADAHLSLQQQRCYGCAPQVSNALEMQAQVSVATGALSSATISGPANSLPDCSKNPSPLTQSFVTLSKDSGSYNGGDRYDLPCAQTDGGALTGSPPPAGTAYTFTLTPAGGSPAQSTYLLNAATNDNGDISTINGVDRATFVANHSVSQVAGTTLTISYSMPATYQVLYSFITAFCANASELGSGLGNGGGVDVNGTLGTIAPSVTSGTITLPTTCDGAAAAGLTVNVWFIGVNGETSLVAQNF